MTQENQNDIFTPHVPELNLEEHGEMLSEFTTEVLDLLIEAKNAVLALEAIPNDQESLHKAFKVFYTIKGLATFLNLSDIYQLAKNAEGLFDALRKGLLPFDEMVADVALEAIDSLRALLDLLNEQIANHGKLSREYLDVSAVVLKIQALNESAIPGRIRKVIDDKRSGKIPLVSLPVSSESDSRVKILKRQQELIRERELAIRLSQQAQKMAAEKSDMLASMSHEMRTLINAIMGFSDLLVKGDLEEKQKIFLRSISSSAELLLDIINNILDLAKIERGKLKLEAISFNLRDLVESVFQIIRARLEQKQILLFFNIDPEVTLGLKGDPTRFRQILINLLGNAVKFTEKGEVGLTVSLDPHVDNTAAMDRSRAYLRFKVSDTGIGISETKLKYIFEPFMQGDKTIAREYGGTGLGLAISKSYIETMGGKIWVESSVGDGSDFIFQVSFPVDEAFGHETTQDMTKVFDLAAGKSVAVIDKDKRQALKSLCQSYHMQTIDLPPICEESFNVLTAHAQQGKAVDIIFIDTIGFKDDAYLLANKLQQDERFAQAKIIAVTSDIKIGVSNEAYKACFDDYLLRPVIRSEFFNLIQKTFDRSSSSQDATIVSSSETTSCAGIEVLIVDDSATNIELIKAYFESIECVGDFAVNGQEAIEKIKQKRYDICFMDLQMPVMNGFAATQIIRSQISQDLPIIALTAADAPEDKEKCQEIGFTDFLSKPFNMNEFKDKIIRYGRHKH